MRSDANHVLWTTTTRGLKFCFSNSLNEKRTKEKYQEIISVYAE